jgi:hypothetical protein
VLDTRGDPSLRSRQRYRRGWLNLLLMIEGRKKKVIPWTATNVRTLKTMAKSKAGVNKISKALKRTEAATMVKASMLGVSLDTRG